MFTKTYAIKDRVLVTTLLTLGWLTWMLCWMAFAWSHYTFLQNLASLGISTLLFAAIAGVLWVGDACSVPAIVIVATLGWFSFALYWIGFAWGQYRLLQNGAVLMVSFLVWQIVLAVFWLARPLGGHS